MDVNTKSLMDIYGEWNPQAYLEGMNQVGMANQAKQQALTKGQQDIGLADLMNPQRVREAELTNQTRAAQLPGIEAQSAMQGDKARMSKDTYAADLENTLKGYKFKDRERELKEMEMGGQAYMQAEPLLATIPPPARHAAAKRLLGAFYQPEFDKVPPEELGRILNFVGSEMMGAQQKLFQAQNIQDSKTQAALAIQDKKSDTAKSLAEFRSRLTQQGAAAKASGDPKTYQAATVRLLELARNETDPERKAEYLGQAQQFSDLNTAALAARAQAGQAGKVDVGAVTGMPTQPPAPTPQLTVPGASPPIQNNPLAASPKPAIKSVKDLSAMYPGVPPAKLKELYKKKFGVDLND